MFDTLARLNGQIIAFTPHVTNGATVTLNVDSLGARPLRSAPGVELLAGTLIQGTPYTVVYNHASAAFYLHGFFGNPYNVPLAAGLDYWAATTPNSAFAFPAGQPISRATYASLFSLIGTTYGAGDGSTTFNLPDKTERVSVMKAPSASRLTTAGSGVDGGTLGAVGGVQNVTLGTNQIPSLTSINASQAINVTTTSSTILSNSSGYATVSTPGSGAYTQTLPSTISGHTSTGSNSISVAYTNLIQVPTKTVQPTIVCNYIMRIL